MPIAAALSFIIQAICAVHAMRTGRERWIYFIVLVPGIGCAVYFISEILPELRHNREARHIKNGLIKAIDPQREVRTLKENRLILADACVEAGHYDEAIEIYRASLQLEEHDAAIMEKLATAYFHNNQFNETKQTLEEIIEHNPEYKSVDGHLLYARTQEALGDTNAACSEYRVLVQTYPGEEARCRYALLLNKLGQAMRPLNCLMRFCYGPGDHPGTIARHRNTGLTLPNRISRQ